MSAPEYVVGIDLGTTNTAVAAAPCGEGPSGIEIFPVPQLVGEGEVTARPVLPSVVYLASGRDLPAGALALPWDRDREYAVGEFARIAGMRQPGRLVVSAKSWLCHGGVDRQARILPWGGAEDCSRISPVTASSLILAHIREAWDSSHPKAPLAGQDVVITVPASFDEYARELTIEAAKEAGLERFTLIEEPQAALYAWIWARERSWQEALCGVDRLVVVDVGGGTTDFALVAVRRAKGSLRLERLAVGEHLLLGGDNMDIALARSLEKRMVGDAGKLESGRWQLLVARARAAKEALLSPEAPAEVRLEIPGSGRSVVGGLISGRLGREEVRDAVIEGFFPMVEADAPLREGAGAGVREWGLPFAQEPEITRHLAGFLRRHAGPGEGEAAGLVRPDAVLFNGGVMIPEAIRSRVTETIGAWFGGKPPRVLEGVDLNLAVARGAAYYGLARRGLGVRITGGSARSYYLGLASGGSGRTLRLLCLVTRGMEEGEEQEIREPEFEILANQPVGFPVYTSTSRSGERCGQIVEADSSGVTALSPLRTVLRFGRKLEARTVPVTLTVRLSEIGTLEIWCSSKISDHRWRLSFTTRESDPVKQGGSAAQASAELIVGSERLAVAGKVIEEVFSAGGDPVGMMRELEAVLGAGREAWPLEGIRALWEVLWAVAEGRLRSASHEARWLNLCGFLLRPGYGDDMDQWRLRKLWPLFERGLVFPRAVQNRAEWWNLWKRVAGGLNRMQQKRLADEVTPYLLAASEQGGAGKKRQSRLGSRPTPQEIREMWQAVGACERLEPSLKERLAEAIVADLARGKASDQQLWALSRLGARQPLYGPLNCVVSARHAARWVERALAIPAWPKEDLVAFALVQVCRLVGDRERDVEQSVRDRLAARIGSLPKAERAVRLLSEALPLSREEQARLLDESLPTGLRTRDSV